jgi:hypothetical protein
MRKFVGAILLTGVLMTPAMMIAKDHDRDDHRYYDPYKKDYHEWNENEARAYRHWVEQERHQQYRDWHKASKRDQREYWRWRHDHQDWR